MQIIIRYVQARSVIFPIQIYFHLEFNQDI